MKINGIEYKEPKIGAWKEFSLYQYTSRGKVDGIKGNVDLNISKIKPQDTPEIPEPIEVLKPVENPTTGQIEANNDTPSDVVQVHEAEKPTPTFTPTILLIINQLITKLWNFLKSL